jgi:polyisoprenoid-binding protein YceI
MKFAVVCGTAVLFTAGILTASAVPPRNADAYQVDSTHSSMVFRVKHMGTSNFYGRFNNITGSFTLDDDPSKCAFAVELKTDNVDTANPKRDQHLKSPDFFNAKQFPTISFKSTQVKKSADGNFEVIGDLTLHGVTKPVTAKVTKTGAGKMQGRQLAGVEAELSIKRSDFGMSFMLEGIGDDILVIMGLEGNK